MEKGREWMLKLPAGVRVESVGTRDERFVPPPPRGEGGDQWLYVRLSKPIRLVIPDGPFTVERVTVEQVDA